MKHRKLAEDCWRLIRALAPETGMTDELKMDDVDRAAITLIEMACDSAALDTAAAFIRAHAATSRSADGS